MSKIDEFSWVRKQSCSPKRTKSIDSGHIWQLTNKTIGIIQCIATNGDICHQFAAAAYLPEKMVT